MQSPLRIGMKMKFLVALWLLSGLSSCEDDFVLDLIESSVEVWTAEDLLVGDYYQGGIIIALDESGKHGLIAAIQDQGGSKPWWNGAFVQTHATSTSDGHDNTKKILRVQGHKLPYAAKLCADFEYERQDDWFLPSKDQLQILYENQHLLDGLSHELYWSSTEHETGRAWVQNFTTGEQYLVRTSETARMHTRALREF